VAEAHRGELQVPKLHIVCLRPGGMNRGGKRHEGHGVHELSDFTVGNLREMFDDANLVLIMGGEAVTEAQVMKIEADAAAAAEKAAKAKG
jgi:hypothetical protein